MEKVLRREAKAQDAEEIRDLIKSSAIKISRQEGYLIAAFKTAIKRKVTIYDSLFIELAKSANVELVNSDDEQAEAAKKEGVKVTKVYGGETPLTKPIALKCRKLIGGAAKPQVRLEGDRNKLIMNLVL